MPETLQIGRDKLTLSNLDKVLYPATGFTKGQVIEYYMQIAPVLLPHLRHRALTLKRYPNGVEAEFFYEKRCPPYRPKFIELAPMPSKKEGTLHYCRVDTLPGLIWIANLASIELHALLSSAKKPERPMWMVFDLDPGPPAGLRDCIPVALRLRDLLKDHGLESFPKTSGGKGIHLWVPLNTAVTFDQTKAYAQQIAQAMERDDPRRITSNMSKALREGRIFIDWSQNDTHKTTVVVYSLRARPQPSVSTPITWDELAAAKKSRSKAPLFFAPEEALKRVERLGDLFAPVLTMKQKVKK